MFPKDLMGISRALGITVLVTLEVYYLDSYHKIMMIRMTNNFCRISNKRFLKTCFKWCLYRDPNCKHLFRKNASTEKEIDSIIGIFWLVFSWNYFTLPQASLKILNIMHFQPNMDTTEFQKPYLVSNGCNYIL